MSQAITFLNPKPSQPALRMVGLLAIQVVLTSDTYATASGGVTIDLTTILANACPGGVNFNDIVNIDGETADGYKVVSTLVALATSTFRLYTSGASEIADASITKTLRLRLWLAGGALGR